MARFAANLSMLFKEVPFLERFAAAREAGFDAVEILFPYDDPAPLLRELLVDNDLTLVLMNAPPPNYTDRPRGFAAVPGGEALFETDLRRALRVASVLRPKRLHMMSGNAKGEEARATMIANLRRALEAETDCSFTIEPLNPDDMPGYFLNDFALAAGIIEEIGDARLGLQFDLYHARKLGLDPVATFKTYAEIISHIQISGPPGRGAPDPSDPEFETFRWAVDGADYDGWIAGEYTPTGKTTESLAWST